MKDHIVEEVRRVREEHAAEFHYDVDAIYADLKRSEAERKQPRVSLGPRRIEKLFLRPQYRVPTTGIK